MFAELSPESKIGPALVGRDDGRDRIIAMSTQTQAAGVAYRQTLTDRLIKDGIALSELNQETTSYYRLQPRRT
jgi:hypothetical protein